MKRVLVVIFVLVVILCVVNVPSASAYSLFPFWWDDVDELEYYMPYVLAPAYANAWLSAVSDWNGTNTDVDISWTSSGEVIYCGIAYEYSSLNGFTLSTYSGTDYMYADCRFNTYNSLPSWPGNELRNVAGHELGHAIGLADQYTTGAALMYYSHASYTTYGVYTPCQDDVNGVNARY